MPSLRPGEVEMNAPLLLIHRELADLLLMAPLGMTKIYTYLDALRVSRSKSKGPMVYGRHVTFVYEHERDAFHPT